MKWLICCLPFVIAVPSFAAVGTNHLSGSYSGKPLNAINVDALTHDENNESVLQINAPGGARWRLTMHRIHQSEPLKNDCSIEYIYQSQNAKMMHFECYISDMGDGYYGYEVDNSSIIIDFPSERGGVAWLFSLTQNNHIERSVLPYMSGDEDGITFLIDDEKKLHAISRYDNYMLVPDKEKRYYLHQYEGSSLNLTNPSTY